MLVEQRYPAFVSWHRPVGRAELLREALGP
jgi:hypothetical protein